MLCQYIYIYIHYNYSRIFIYKILIHSWYIFGKFDSRDQNKVNV